MTYQLDDVANHLDDQLDKQLVPAYDPLGWATAWPLPATMRRGIEGAVPCLRDWSLIRLDPADFVEVLTFTMAGLIASLQRASKMIAEDAKD